MKISWDGNNRGTTRIVLKKGHLSDTNISLTYNGIARDSLLLFSGILLRYETKQTSSAVSHQPTAL